MTQDPGRDPFSATTRLTVAPTGARRSKADHPQLPISIDEIAATAAACQAAGAQEIHLHVRDREGRHTLDPGRYREAMAAVADAAPGMAIQITTEAAGRFDVAAQFATLAALVPEAASVSVREMQRDPRTAARLYALAGEAGIRVQHILYDTADLAALRGWLDRGVIPGAMRDVLLVMGSYAPPRPALPAGLAPFVAALGSDFPRWAVCAFGRYEHLVACAAIAMGGDARIGFENNTQRPDGTLAADNAENVARIIAAARAIGRPLVS
ncbi:MAG: 3-keto-5-aminohexanoate cleavage protein [Alphaproteobacteria bacterium]|nr:MAG: 3-keto-5-aminohexanoate cleavage protein [Alphaproteobacteria bacterium]